MFALLKYKNTKFYWIIKNYINQTIFRIQKNIFTSFKAIRLFNEGSSITYRLVKKVFSSILFSIIVIVIIEFIDRIFFTYVNINDVKKIANIPLLNMIISLDKNAFSTQLTIIASIAGVLIGLYFTTLSVVAGSIFAKVPSNLRALLLREKIGNVYVNILAKLTVTSIAMLGFISLGGNFGILIYLYIILFSCFGIFCIVKLGMRVFLFFDPSLLSDSIFNDLKKEIELASVKGFAWTDRNFQSFYQENTKNLISTLETLIDICINEPYLHNKSLSYVLNGTINFLSYYTKHKSYIPKKSLWYILSVKYHSWFLSSAYEKILALNTQTELFPKMEQDFYWLENKILDIIYNAIKKILAKNNYDILLSFMRELNEYLEILGNYLEIKRGQNIIKEIDKIVEKNFKESAKIMSFDVDENRIGLFDLFGLTNLNLIFGFKKFIENTNLTFLTKNISNINWLKKNEIYNKNFPHLVLARLEYIQERIVFEQSVEKRIITPIWYITQLVLIRYLEIINDITNDSINFLKEFYVDKSREYFLDHQYILSAIHTQRGLEACIKFQEKTSVFNILIEELEKKMIIKDLKIAEWDWIKLNDSINNSYKKLVQNLSECTPKLALIERYDKFPDIFGHSLGVICNECFNAMHNKEIDQFKLIFSYLPICALLAHERIKKETKDWEPESSIVFSFDPIMDVLMLSGYAKIYAELYDIPDIWESCKDYWDLLYKQYENKKHLIEFLINIYNYVINVRKISPSDEIRPNWQRNLELAFHKMNLFDEYDSFGTFYNEEEIEHKSSLIRAIAQNRSHILITGADIFILIYLMKKPEAEGINFVDKYNLSRRIEEENEKDQKRDNS